MTTTQLKPKTPRKKRGVFNNLNLQENDRLFFVGKGVAEVHRGDRFLCRIQCDWEPEPQPLQKRAGGGQKKAIPEGARWITVNPTDTPGAGQPVLIMPQSDGTATVIGGAGGKLNMLKLRNVGNEATWQERAKERKEKEKQRKAEQTEEERETEETAVRQVKERQTSDRAKNASRTLAVLDAAGIESGLSPEHKLALQQPPDPGAEPEKVKEWQQLNKEAIARVRAIHQAYERELVTNHEARAAAQLGDVDYDNRIVANRPHTACATDGAELSRMQQLPTGEWLVKSDDDSKTFKSWADAAKHHAQNVQQAEQELGGDRTQPDSFYSPSQWIAEPKSELLPEGFEFKPEVALQIAALSAERKAADKAARVGVEEAKRSPLEVMEGLSARVQEITEQEVIAKLEAEAKTLSDAFTNNAFLELIEDAGDAAAIQRHAQTGGYSKLAEIASDALKQNPISRGLVDAVGYNEAAKILSYMMRQNLGDREFEAVVAAQAAYHAMASSRIAKATTERIKPMLDQLKQIHEEMLMIDEMAGGELSPEQQIQLDTLTYDAKTLHDSIQETLGSTLGQLQASAAMVAALEGGGKQLTIMGRQAEKVAEKLPGLYGQTNLETGEVEPQEPSIFDAYGLTPDDYQLFDTSDGTAVRIKESGLQKLAVGYNPEDREAYERAIAIKRGEMDEENFVPTGFSYYAKASFSDAGTEALQFETKFDVLGKLAAAEGAGDGTLSLFGDPEPSVGDVSDQEVEDGLTSYIGARVANGENPLDVMNDIRSPEFYMQQGIDPYGQSALRVQNIASEMVKRVAGGDRISDKAVISAFQALGDAEAAKQRRARQTDDLQALRSQKLESNAAVEAAHRTLAAMPMARTVFKPWENLTGRERKWLREYAITEILGQALEPPKSKKSEAALPDEVAEEQYDLFGNKISAAEALGQEDDGPEFSQWQSFAKLMGGDDKAYAAVRDQLRGKFLHRFANAYGAISGKPPLIGGENISHVDRLLLAKMPEAQRNEMLEFMRSRQQSDIAKVRSRSRGKFASEMDDEWLAKYEELKGDNRQISLLTADSGRSTAKTDFQRTTLGADAEAQLGQLMESVLPNFDQINAPVAVIPEVNWGAGTQHVTKQRFLKFLESQKRAGLHAGVGSGKSATLLGSFTHLHAQGKVKKAVFAVPSSIVSQFLGEAVTFLEPGKYNYSANLGFSREERLKAIADPNNHIFFTTRESLTNDLLYLVEKHQGISPEQFQEASDAEQKAAIQAACKAEGIDTEGLLFAVDEAHDISARKGVDPSKRSLALKGLGHHSGYYVEATGDLLKNDLSEAYSFLNAVAPDKFNDLKKFMAEYGGNTPSARRALQRAIAPYSFVFSTKPQDRQGKMLKMNEYQPSIPVSEAIAKQRQQVLDDVQVLSEWQSRRRQELKAEKGDTYQPTTEDFNTAWSDATVRAALDRLGSEDTWGAMSDEDKQKAIGGQIRAIGGLKRTALWRLYHRAPFADNPKAQWTVDKCVEKFKKEGKSGIVFSSSSQAAEMLVEEMKRKGLKVGYLHGGLSSMEKGKVINGFQSDTPEFDVMVLTDAGRTGINLTRAKYVCHYDIPPTAMSYSQRSARSYRLKQTEDVEVFIPMLDTPEERIALSRMENKAKIASPVKSKAELIDDSGLAMEIKRQRLALKIA